MRSRRGFTLTELLVVLAIIVLLVAVSVPAFISAHKVGRLAAAVRMVQAGLMGARNRAVAYNAIYSVELGRIELVVRASPDMDLVASFDDTDNDNVVDDFTLLSDAEILEAGRQGCFVAVQAEGSAYAGAAPAPDDYLVREVLVLPRGIAFAYAAYPEDDPDTPTWTAMPGWEDDTDDQEGEHFDDRPSFWSAPPLNNSVNGVPDIAFMPDGSCADALGETTVVLYDTSEEPDAEGNVTVKVITVVKYTGEVLIETRKARLSDLTD